MAVAAGAVYPDAFLPLVDSAGLMPALTAAVLDEAVAQTARWHRAGHLLTVSVNVPASGIVDDALPGRVLDLLAEHELPAWALQLEITQESLLADRLRARVVLARLRAAGVGVAIDDYGTGYSSLAYLRELPVDELKLDRSFIRPMSHDERAASIVRSTVDLAHSLGLTIVAEGVEDESAAATLAAFGCDTAQGYHFARPLPTEQLSAWLDTHLAANPLV